ncbi:MAG TPA: NAD(P)-binding domain-containing protein [Bacteroidales bacterium]|nr:NAD(P)-binding domain-containing protein [Bacteroidales bacterium]
MKNYFTDTGYFTHDVLNLSAREAFRLCEDGAFIIDVRETYLSNFKMFGTKNVVYLPYSELTSTYQQLPLNIPLIFADAVGLHSREAVMFMMEKGYQNVANLSGGIVDWEKDGFPVTTDKEYRLTGSCMCQLKPREAKTIIKNSDMEQSIGFIGGGRITRILLQAFRNKSIRFKEIVVTDPDAEALKKLKTCYPSYRIADPATAAAQDIVFVSLHPPLIMDTLESLKGNISSKSTIISLAPKITISKMAMKLGHVIRLARMIPNATSFINEGYNPICFGQDFPEPEKKIILEMLGNLGKTFEVPESKLESYAIMSAMLPTYFWFQWQELAAIGEKIGLSESESRESINQTMLASLDLMFKSGLKPEEVIDLIPVKPIGENESQIRDIYNTKLTGLYEKIKP